MNDDLAVAAGRGDVAEVKRLLRSGDDPNGLSSDGVPPLFDAAAFGHADIIKILAEAGADVNYTSQVEYTPLMAAATLAWPEPLEALLDAGADISATDKSGRNAMAIACKEGSARTVSCLLEHGAAINEHTGPSAATPLMRAIYNTSFAVEIIELLLARGADVTIVDSTGLTAIDHARKRNPECLPLLSEG